MKEIRALTSLRGIFAMWVIGFHLRWLRVAPMPDPRAILERGYLGVDFFFLLSGFVLAGAYGAIPIAPLNYVRFIIARAGRLFPLHIAVIAVCVIVAWALGHPFGGYQVLVELLLLHRWPGVPAPIDMINGPAWSISVEWLGNLLFPILVAVTLRPKPSLAILCLALSVAALALLTISHSGTLDIVLPVTPALFLRCLTELLIGMSLFRWRAVFDGLPKNAAFVLCILGVVAAFAGLADLGLVILLSLIIPAVAADRGLMSKILSAQPLHWLGEVSFSVYLVHMPILRAVRWYLQMVSAPPSVKVALFVFGTVGVTLAVSYFSYRWIESPARDAAKRLARRISAPRALVV